MLLYKKSSHQYTCIRISPWYRFNIVPSLDEEESKASKHHVISKLCTLFTKNKFCTPWLMLFNAPTHESVIFSTYAQMTIKIAHVNLSRGLILHLHLYCVYANSKDIFADYPDPWFRNNSITLPTSCVFVDIY